MNEFNGTAALISNIWEEGVKDYILDDAKTYLAEAVSFGHQKKDLKVITQTGISKYNIKARRPYFQTGQEIGYQGIRNVHPTGRVEIYSANKLDMRRVAKLFWDMMLKIIDLSPIGKVDDKRPGHPGLYLNSHVFTINGKVIKLGVDGLTKKKLAEIIKPGDRFEMFNTTIYARKFETEFKRQKYREVKMRRKAKVSRRPASSIAPNGVYDVVQKNYGRRNSKHVFMQRGFKRDLNFLGIGHTVRHQKTGNMVGQIYPMISGIIL